MTIAVSVLLQRDLKEQKAIEPKMDPQDFKLHYENPPRDPPPSKFLPGNDPTPWKRKRK